MPQVGALARLEPYHCQTADEVRALARRVYKRRGTNMHFRSLAPLAVIAKPKQIKTLPEPKVPLETQVEKLFRWRGPAKTVLHEVAEKYELSVPEITGTRRINRFIVPRQEAAYRMKVELKMSYPAIGRALGGRDHSTAIHSVRAHAKRNNLPVPQ